MNTAAEVERAHRDLAEGRFGRSWPASASDEEWRAKLTEEQYRRLQQLGDFDTKTSSWITTPPAIRAAGACPSRTA